MAYVAATVRAGGSLITAAIWNQDVVDNVIALRAGGKSLTSQATRDFLYASSATQLARLAQGAAGLFLRFTGSAWEFASPALTARPVGSVFISILSTNPSTYFGGTWARFGEGRTLVGINGADTDFDTVRKTGGAKTHTLTTAELPSHSHTQDSHNHTQDSHNHTQDAHTHGFSDAGHTHRIFLGSAAGAGGRAREGNNVVTSGTTLGATTNTTLDSSTATNQATTATNQNTTATNQNTGGGAAHNNLQPYIVVYMWERTA